MKWLVMLLGALILIMVLLFQGGQGGSNSPKHSPSLAILMCRDFVKRQLVAPATAQFSNEDAGKHMKGETYYEVLGAVDSENAFGALLRQRYLCIVQYRGSTNDWRLDSLDWLK